MGVLAGVFIVATIWILLAYWLFDPELDQNPHWGNHPIKQELIKSNKKDYLYGVEYNLEEE